MTSWPGGRENPLAPGTFGTHGGVDAVRKPPTRGEPFYSVLPGDISQGRDPGGGGLWTSLFARSGDYIGYGHALDFAPGAAGKDRPAGTLLGWCDSTGASTGDHMHLAENIGGAGPYDDPVPFWQAAAAANLYPEYIIGGTPVIPDKPQQPNTIGAMMAGPYPFEVVYTDPDPAQSTVGLMWYIAPGVPFAIPIGTPEQKRLLLKAGVIQNHPLAAPENDGVALITEPGEVWEARRRYHCTRTVHDAGARAEAQP